MFPGSLYGGRWADGPRVKPELVSLSTELRRAGFAVDVLDLEVECGNPGDDARATAFLARADELLAARPADLVVVSCWSALQYTAAVAVAERVRRLASGGGDRRRRLPRLGAPGRLRRRGRPVRLAHRRRGRVGRAHASARAVAAASARPASAARSRARRCRSTRTTPPTSPPTRTPAADLPELGVFLSRGCPYNAPACLLRPGGGGWHAYPPHVAVAILDGLSELAPARIDVLDPAFGYDAVWRRAVLDGLAAADRRDLAITVAGKPADLDARRRRQAVPGAPAPAPRRGHAVPSELLARTGQAPQPPKAVEHALDLLDYANAKGLVTVASFTFNQPGETRETAAETLDALERFVDAAPNTSVVLQAQPWAYLPAGEPAADIEAPAQRFGTRIVHPAVVEGARRPRSRRQRGRRQPRAGRPAGRRRELLAAALRRAARAPRSQADLRGAARPAQPRGGGLGGLPGAARLVGRAALALTSAPYAAAPLPRRRRSASQPRADPRS